MTAPRDRHRPARDRPADAPQLAADAWRQRRLREAGWSDEEIGEAYLAELLARGELVDVEVDLNPGEEYPRP
jgi:hypothetical protein